MMFKYLLSPQTVPHSPSDDNANSGIEGAMSGTVATSAMAGKEEKDDEISQLEVVDASDDDDENCQRDSQSPDLPETTPPESIDVTNSQVKWSHPVESLAEYTQYGFVRNTVKSKLVPFLIYFSNFN